MTHSVEIRNISTRFGKKVVLNEVDMAIKGGSIYGFIGPSDAGKTTLIKMIVGMDSPDHGSIEVLGTKMPNLKLLQDIGYMAQSDALYTELTGKENLRSEEHTSELQSR